MGDEEVGRMKPEANAATRQRMAAENEQLENIGKDSTSRNKEKTLSTNKMSTNEEQHCEKHCKQEI